MASANTETKFLHPQKNHTMQTGAKVILAAIVGAMAGTITGLMLAPNSGRETRVKLSEKSDEVLEYLNDFAAKLKKVNEQVEEALDEDED